jgi:hydroxymethylbilane synthase
VRRVAQLRALRPDLRPADIRGNVPTRVAKLRAGDYDGLMLAAAGLDRLGLDLAGLQRVDLDPAVFLPAPAQGALALEIRRGDPLGDALTDLHDVPASPPSPPSAG